MYNVSLGNWPIRWRAGRVGSGSYLALFRDLRPWIGRAKIELLRRSAISRSEALLSDVLTGEERGASAQSDAKGLFRIAPVDRARRCQDW
jgi:hypothetical protein